MIEDVPSGLTPLNKTALSGEMKIRDIYPKTQAELVDSSGMITDSVELMREIQSMESTYVLTNNPNLNHYIKMLEEEKYLQIGQNDKLIAEMEEHNNNIDIQA